MVWPDSLSEWLVDGAGLQQMFCCLTASTARAMLCMADFSDAIPDTMRNGVSTGSGWPDSTNTVTVLNGKSDLSLLSQIGSTYNCLHRREETRRDAFKF